MISNPIPILLMIVVLVAAIDIVRGLLDHDDFEN